MESRIRVFLLILSLSSGLSGCAVFRGGEAEQSAPSAEEALEDPTQRSVVEPEVVRREVVTPRIDTENFEVGAFAGILSIEDFGTNSVTGLRLAYHLNEDFFLEAMYGKSDAGRTSIERLSGAAQILSDSQRDYQYYSLSAGWNALPGQIYLGPNRAYNTALYLIGGLGNTSFGGDELITINIGVGYRLLVNDYLAVHFDFQDHVYNSDVLGTDQNSNNLEAHLGLTAFF
jgi:outer membrane beta-barrel protein